jgi:hypothetical protein
MDLRPGIGSAAIASAELGASSVTTWGGSPRAVRCTQHHQRYVSAEVTHPTLDASAPKGC